MGVDARRKPPLPAPTESSTLHTSGDDIPTDLATDVSRRTDRTSYSIPEDGNPITVRTSGKGEKALHRRDQSQTSLLIEYFEGGKGTSVHSKPSVRVRVTPSSAKKGKDTKDHIQVTQTEGGRKPSYTRRISLGPKDKGETHIIEGGESKSVSSMAEDSNLSARHPPVEVEVLHRDQGSDLSGTSVSRENRYMAYNQSEISSMPPDSMLDEKAKPVTPKRSRSRSLTRLATASTAAAVGAAAVADTLKTPSRRRSRSLSRERIARNVIEKLEAKEPGISSGKHRHKHHSSKSRSRSISKEQLVEPTGSPRKSGKHHRLEELPSESSVLTGSQVSEARSYRSDASKYSVTNPKLLAAVEDSIKRLILPELNALKAEQNRHREYEDRRDSVSSSRDGEISKRGSKGSHREDFLKKKSRRHHEKYEDSPSERSFEREKSQETVVHDGGRKHRKRSKEGSHLKDAAAGAVVGGLTYAALKHHDSSSTVDRKERRRKRSKSHSRSHSVSNSAAGTEEIFNKHDVPPMPMRSEITSSEVTRDSILSEETSTPTSEQRKAEIRHVARGLPGQAYSPSQTPTRSPSGLRNSAAYDDEYQDEYSQDTQSYEEEPRHYGEAALAGAAAGAGLMAAHHALGQHDDVTPGGYQHGRSLSPIQSVASFEEMDELSRKNSKRQHRNTTSTSSLDNQQERSSKHLSMDSEPGLKPKNRPKGISLESPSEVMIAHVASQPSLDKQKGNTKRLSDSDYSFKATNRPQSISFESGSEILAARKEGFRDEEHERHRNPADESWFEGDDTEQYRNSGTDSYDSSKVPIGRLTQYTDDSMDAPYLNKVAAAQEVRGIGANPEWVHTPIAVESAVASLHDPSILESSRSYHGDSHVNSPGSDGRQEFAREEHEVSRYKSGSPLKRQYNAGEDIRDSQFTAESPRQSLPASENNRESYVEMNHSALPDPLDPMPEIMDVESEIDTNPPDIQGPKKYDTPIQWPYHQATPPQTAADNLVKSNNASAHDSLASAAKNMLGVAAAAGAAAAISQKMKNNLHPAKDSFEDLANEDSQDKDFATDENHKHGSEADYGTVYPYGNEQHTQTSPRDEGYVTQQEQDRSAGALTPDNRRKHGKVPELFPDPTGGIGLVAAGAMGAFAGQKDDPFINSDPRRISGNSHGMMSPLYDGATGEGIDKIQSKDVVALMQLLTVRDGHKNAVDTEIIKNLVTLGAELRNGFADMKEEMKRFIKAENDTMIQVANRQHERTQRVIGGPRPQPQRRPRGSDSAEDSIVEDTPTKRRNMFRRALKGLSGKDSEDIKRIEGMFLKVLDEVASLRAELDARPTTAFAPRAPGLSSYEQLRDAPTDRQDGYEPEGQAGTSSTEDQSGYFSNPGSGRNSRQQFQDRRRASQNRISTVVEEREEEEMDAPLEQHEQDLLQYENTEEMLTPTRDLPRGGSVPAEGSPAANLQQEPQSYENTPKTDKGRKSKTGSSWFSPKISRWSKTTTSSVPEGGRKSLQKERPFSGISRSGSDIPNYDGDHYDPTGDDRLRSNTSLANDGRPPSPLVPSAVSEKPQYHAHRNSIILQHPQPRQGPTARFQNHLESQVRDVSSPISPTSDHFGSNPILAARWAANAGNRSSGVGNLTPISDVGGSEVSGQRRSSAPPRPPKVKDDGPLIPPKIPLEENKPSYVERSAPARELSQPNGASLSPPSGKKPGGPRPQTTSGSYSPDRVATLQKKRYRGSPNALPGGEEDETF